MTAKMQQRGHEICFRISDARWVYSDDDTPITIQKPCTQCGKMPINDVDYCLMDLVDCKGITNACCGHGNDEC